MAKISGRNYTPSRPLDYCGKWGYAMKHKLAAFGLLLVAAGFLAAAPRAHGETRVYINPGSRIIVDRNTAVVLPYTPVVGPGFIYWPPASMPERVIYTEGGGGEGQGASSSNGDTYVDVNGADYLVRRNGMIVGSTPWAP